MEPTLLVIRTLNVKGLRRLLDRVEAAINELEAQNSTGGDRPALSLPNELASAEALRQRVKEALARVENEEGRRYENLTDKDAGLLTSKGGFIAGYNAQAVVTPLSPTTAEDGGSPVCRPGMIIAALPADDRRRPYRLTAAGSDLLRASLNSLSRVANLGLQRLAST